MKNIRIEFVDQCRYQTSGDYFERDGEIIIQVKRQIRPAYNFLIALHEFFEQFATEMAGIKEEDIMAFDLAHPDSDEPGAEQDAPYRSQHEQSELLERIAANFLNIDWQKYEQEIIISE